MEKETLYEIYFNFTEETLLDEYGRPYEKTTYGRIYLSRKTKYEYLIKN